MGDRSGAQEAPCDLGSGLCRMGSVQMECSPPGAQEVPHDFGCGSRRMRCKVMEYSPNASYGGVKWTEYAAGKHLELNQGF